MLTKLFQLASKTGRFQRQDPHNEQNDLLLGIAVPTTSEVRCKTKDYFLISVLFVSFLINVYFLSKGNQSLPLHNVCSSFTSEHRESISSSESSSDFILMWGVYYKLPYAEWHRNLLRVSSFNGSFSKKTEFRNTAGPEVDEAWKSLSTDCTTFASVYVRSANDSNVDFTIIVSEEDEIEKYSLLPGYVKRRKDQGGGYLANVEVLHHLHCLVLRTKTLSPTHFSLKAK